MFGNCLFEYHSRIGYYTGNDLVPSVPVLHYKLDYRLFIRPQLRYYSYPFSQRPPPLSCRQDVILSRTVYVTCLSTTSISTLLLHSNHTYSGLFQRLPSYSSNKSTQTSYKIFVTFWWLPRFDSLPSPDFPSSIITSSTSLQFSKFSIKSEYENTNPRTKTKNKQ